VDLEFVTFVSLFLRGTVVDPNILNLILEPITALNTTKAREEEVVA
jgi:hypothetical protein